MTTINASMQVTGVLVLSSFCCLSLAQQALTPRQIAARYRDSIVSVRTTTLTEIYTGTGFFYRDDRNVVTSYHVVKDAERIDVIARDGTHWQPTFIAFDMDADVAILRLARHTGRTPIPHAVSSSVFPGDPIVVIGSPLGLTGSVSTGIVAERRSMNGVPEVQFTAPISHGSSGGPVLDIHGRAVGVVKATLIDGQNLNLAVSSIVSKVMFDDFDKDIFHRTYIVVSPEMFRNIHNPFWEPLTDPAVRAPSKTKQETFADPKTFFDDPVTRSDHSKSTMRRGSKQRRKG